MLFPAYAGVILTQKFFLAHVHTFPRIRGGDPHTLGSAIGEENFSPHTRG